MVYLVYFSQLLLAFNSIRAGQKLGALKKPPTKLSIKSQVTIYKAHVRSVMEYASLRCMSAQPTHLGNMKALKIIGVVQVSCLFSISHPQP